MQSIEPDDNQSESSAGCDYVFGASVADNFYCKYGDRNANGIVDLLDFSTFRQTSADVVIVSSMPATV